VQKALEAHQAHLLEATEGQRAKIGEGLTYEAKDANGNWWKCTIVKKNEDGTYATRLHKGEAVWPSVHECNLRELSQADTLAAALDTDGDGDIDFEDLFADDEYSQYVKSRADKDKDGSADWHGYIAPGVLLELLLMIGGFFGGLAVTPSIEGEIEAHLSWTDTYWSTYVCSSGKDLRGEAQRLVLYTWTHNSYGHLIMNCMLFVLFAWEFENAWGTLRTLAVFLFGGVWGALLFTANTYNFHVDEALVGASGSIYAFLGARLANLFLNGDSMYNQYKAKLQLLGLAAALGLEVYHYVSGTVSGVSYIAHVGGAIGGFFWGILLIPNLRVRGLEELQRYALVALLAVASIALIAGVYTTDPSEMCSQD
jgi:membrane associated rhomboid family serine protease